MNKLKVTLLYALALFAVVSLNSCGSEEDKLPANVIEDASGVNISLEWTTGGTVQAAEAEADIDIIVYRDGKEVTALSRATYGFDNLELTDVYADGTYTIAAYLYSTSKRADYTVTVNGVTVNNPSKFTSYFVAGATSTEAMTVKVTKLGNKYTIDDAN